MAYKKYILPKSIFVETRTIADRERPTIANYGLDLYKFIQSVVDDVIPGTILNANNGLHVTGNFIQLGGDLIQNTVIDGDGEAYSLNITNIDDFSAEAATLTISANSSMFVYTPQINQSLAHTGQVLTLIDDVTGECDWDDALVLGANNGLHLTGNAVYLGGDLSEDTVIDGTLAGWNLTVQDVGLLTLNAGQTFITADNAIDIDSIFVNIIAPNSFVLKTPAYASATNRTHALHMINVGTGEAEFKALNFFPITTVAVAGVYHVAGNESTILVDPTTAGGAIVIDLPAATGVGMLVRVKQITAGAVTIASLSGDLWTTTNVASIPGVHGTTYTLQADGTY